MSSRFITEDDLKKVLESLQVGEPIDFISLYASNTLSLTSTFQILPYNTIRSQVSNGGFTHNGQGGIICNKNGYIEISACYYYTGTQGELYYLYPHKNDVVMSGVAERCASTTDYVSLPAFIISVASGDIITFKGKSGSGKAGVFANGGIPLSNATLKYINGSTYNTNSIYNFNIDMIYPVGSIYMSVNNVSPETFIPGTVWESLTNRFLIGAGDTYGGGAKGGETTHMLTVDEIPSHRHQESTNNFAWKANSAILQKGTSWNASTGQTLYTGYTGDGKAHNNMPPYLAVYMWKRTA